VLLKHFQTAKEKKMADQPIPTKPVNSASERGAELIDIILDTVKLVRLESAHHLGLHITRSWVRRVEETGRQDDIQLVKEEERESEQQYEETSEKLDCMLFRLEAIKLSLQGKTPDEIEDELERRGRNLKEIKTRLAAAGK
jgi:hypothetical protein